MTIQPQDATTAPPIQAVLACLPQAAPAASAGTVVRITSGTGVYESTGVYEGTSTRPEPAKSAGSAPKALVTGVCEQFYLDNLTGTIWSKPTWITTPNSASSRSKEYLAEVVGEVVVRFEELVAAVRAKTVVVHGLEGAPEALVRAAQRAISAARACGLDLPAPCLSDGEVMFYARKGLAYLDLGVREDGTYSVFCRDAQGREFATDEDLDLKSGLDENVCRVLRDLA